VSELTWTPLATLAPLSATDEQGGYGAVMCDMGDDVLAVVIYTGQDMHMFAVRCDGDGTVTVGPRAVYWNAYAHDDGTAAADPLLGGQSFNHEDSILAYRLADTDSFAFLAGTADQLPPGYPSGNYVMSSTYHVDKATLAVTRTNVVETPDYTYGTSRVNACAWGDNYVISDGYEGEIISGTPDAGVLNKVAIPNSNSYAQPVVVGDKLVLLQNTTYTPDAVVAHIFQLSGGGIGAKLSQVNLPGSYGFAGGDFPTVFGCEIAGRAAVITQAAGESSSAAWGSMLLYYIDPASGAVSAPQTVVADTAGIQGNRGGFYNSHCTFMRSVSAVDDETLLINWYDSDGTNKIALVPTDGSTPEVDVCTSMPPMVDLSYSGRWQRAMSLPLGPGRFALTLLGPNYPVEGEPTYGAYLTFAYAAGAVPAQRTAYRSRQRLYPIAPARRWPREAWTGSSPRRVGGYR
jgi:hypothetical protein